MEASLTPPGGTSATARPRRTVLVGFMGAGKSTAARSAAAALGVHAIDVDEVLEERLGKPIAEVFAQDGEAAFRAAEEQATLELLGAPDGDVVALGGGAVLNERVRSALQAHRVIWLDVSAEQAWGRVQGAGRPLARDPEQFRTLLAEREPVYAALADVVVPASLSADFGAVLARLDEPPAGVKTLWAASASGDYPAYVGPGLLAADFWPASVDGDRFLVTDGTVGRLYGDALGPLAGRVAIMPGEQSKTVAHADIVWSELARAGMTRADVVVALGGGVVGDLAGFCAATYQRGVRWVGVPTTLVAQVDSAYGGKTGVDLPEAKNYVGSYHQPTAVIADTDVLETLADAEVAAGYAEVLKTALIAGGSLWETVRDGADPRSPEVIRSCVLTKLRVVAADERDGGLRQVLNLGHTIGHAIEAVTGYARYRHGEAVALGLLAALTLSEQPELREQVHELLRAQGLPTALDDVDPDAVVMATARDKKRLRGGAVPFVLLDRPGAARPGCEVSGEAVVAAVRALVSG